MTMEGEGKAAWDGFWAVLMLRLFLGLRWVVSAIEKFEADGAYSWAGYLANMERMGKGIASSTFIPEALALVFAKSLGFIFPVLGVALLLGIRTRLALIGSGLMYVGLAFGLMAAEEEQGVAWLAVHVALVAMALVLARYNKFVVWKD